MGATNLEQVIYTTAPAREAYERLVDEAISEYGNDPYNGTISTSGGYRIHGNHAMTEAEAYKVAEQRLSSLNKWEAFEAIALVDPKTIKTRRVTRTFKITGKAIKDAGSLSAAIKSAAMGISLREGEKITRYAVATENGTWGNPKQTLRHKATSRATEGKAVTRYFVKYANRFSEQPEWKNGYATMALARKALEAVAAKPAKRGMFNEPDTISYEIVAEVRREDGRPLAVAVSEVVGAEVEVNIDIEKAPAKRVAAGWLFYGWAAE